MTQFIQYAILGLATGAAYTLLGQGIVLTYRGSGVVNFAQGALAMVAAFTYYTFHGSHHMAFVPAFILTLAICAVLGAVIHVLIMSPLTLAAPMTKAMATLGLFILLEGVDELIYGEQPRQVTVPLPGQILHLGGVTIQWSILTLLAIAIAVTVLLWLASSHTTTGLALRANAENRRVAASLGWSSYRLGLLTWAFGSVLAGLAGILIAPTSGVTVDAMPLLVIPVLAAVIIGRFESFWLTLASGVLVGVAQSTLGAYWHLQGASNAVPFMVLILYLVVRGEGSLTRSQVVERLPSLGTGRVRYWLGAAVIIASLALVGGINSTDLTVALTISLGWAIIILSIVVLVGYTGQLSLAQYSIGGASALIAGQLVAKNHVPFLLAVVVAVVACSLIGMVLALPALRTRGINLAICTLGLSVAASVLVFDNASLTGGYSGLDVGSPHVFGISVDPLLHPGRYAVMAYVLFLLSAAAVASLRRGAAGTRLIATRTNERAAAALGVSIHQAKMFAFGIAAALAALGGVLLAFMNSTLVFASSYDPLASIQTAGYGIVGGAGYIAGAPVGSTFAQGGFGTWILNTVAPSANPVWLTVIAGIALLASVVLQPDGVVKANLDAAYALIGKVRGSKPSKPVVLRKQIALPEQTDGASRRVSAATLAVEDISVKFGSVVAVNSVSLEVRPGEIVGVIGPNGAGKSTLIDAITGFVRPSGGAVRLGTEPLDHLPAYRRARAGVSRSFQSLELFDSATVIENLQVACDDGRSRRYFLDLFHPKPPTLTGRAMLAVREFGLEPDLGAQVSDLSYGRRRLVAIARAAASAQVLLLDEPAAGLSESETAELQEVVRRFAQEWGLAVLVVEHDMTFVAGICDRVVVLDFGAKIADGPPVEVLNDARVVAAYLGAPVEREDIVMQPDTAKATS